MYSHVINVASQEDFGKLINSNKLVVVKFYSTYCSPCTIVAKPFNELSQDPAVSDTIFAQVAVDALRDISNKYGIEYIPHFLFFKSGRVIKQQGPITLNHFKKEMTHLINLLQKNNLTDTQELDKPPSKSHDESFVAKAINSIMMPLHFLANIIKKVINFVKDLL